MRQILKFDEYSIILKLNLRNKNIVFKKSEALKIGFEYSLVLVFS